MIDSIGMNTSMQKPPQKSEPLSDVQLATISETLANFDSENLTEEDAQNIVEAFKAADIKPGKALAAAMSELGFDARAVGELADIEPKGPKPSSQNSEQMSAMFSFLTDTISEQLKQSGNDSLSEEDIKAIYQTVYEKFGMEDNGNIINTTA